MPTAVNVSTLPDRTSVTALLAGAAKIAQKVIKYTHNLYRISNEFSFHTMYYETSCVFYIPEPLARGYKTHNEFHNTSYGMKIHLRFFLSHELTQNEQITR